MPRSRRTVTYLLLVLVLALVGAACTSDGDGDEASDDATEQAAGGDGSVFAGREMPQPTPKPEFTLTDTSGAPYDFATETEGQVTYLYFGYTHCPDICPVHLAQLAAVLDAPGAPANATVVFVTVDPERDTPEVVRDYLDSFDAGFVGLTGTPEELEAAQIAAGVTPAIKEGTGEDYTMGHAGQVIAYAPNGLNYTQYPFGTRQSEFAEDLPILAGLRTADDVPAA